MFGAILGAGVSLLGGIMGNRASRRAQEDGDEEAARNRTFAADQAKVAYNRQRALEAEARGYARNAEKRNDARQLETERRARRYMRADEERARKLAITDRREARIYAGNIAAKERKLSLRDESTRFTRLRAAAEKGGFNPLTVLGAGFVGAGVPTGLISSADALHGTSSGMGFVSNTASSIQIGQGARLPVDHSVSRAQEVGMQAGAMSIEAQASAAASTATRISLAQQGMSSLMGNLFSGLQLGMQWDSDRRAQTSQGMELDLRRREMDIYDRAAQQSAEQQTIATYRNPWGSNSQPAMGATSAAVVNHPTIGNIPPNAVPMNANGTIQDRDLLINGNRYNVNERTSPAQYWEDEYGEVAASIVGLVHAGEDAIAASGGLSHGPFALGVRDGQTVRRWANNAWSGFESTWDRAVKAAHGYDDQSLAERRRNGSINPWQVSLGR